MIVVGIDGGEDSAEILRVAIYEATLRGTRLRVVRAYISGFVSTTVASGGILYNECRRFKILSPRPTSLKQTVGLAKRPIFNENCSAQIGPGFAHNVCSSSRGLGLGHAATARRLWPGDVEGAHGSFYIPSV